VGMGFQIKDFGNDRQEKTTLSTESNQSPYTISSNNL
jgi:hypothetical protein